MTYDCLVTKNFSSKGVSTCFVALLQGILGVLNPGVTIFITLQFNVLWDERSASDWNGLVPCFVVDLSESVGVADELTSGPLCELTIVPGQIALAVILIW